MSRNKKAMPHLAVGADVVVRNQRDVKKRKLAAPRAPIRPNSKSALETRMPHVPQFAPTKNPNLPQLPHLSSRTDGDGAMGQGSGRACKKQHVIKNTRLTDHEIELMRTMYEEFPAGHPKHIGQRKLAAIFCCSRAYAQNVVLYRRRR